MIITLSIVLRLVALCWSLTALRRMRDLRFALLPLMLALMTVRQALTLWETVSDRGGWNELIEKPSLSELPGLAVSVLALFATIAVARMLTEQRAMVDGLRASELRFANASKVVAMGSCELVLPERRVRDCGSLEGLLRIDPGSLEGPVQQLIALFAPDDGKALAAAIEALANREHDGFDLLLRTAGGADTGRDLQVRAQYMGDPSPPGHATLAMADVGQPVRIQRAVEVLARSESSAQSVEDRLHEIAATLAKELPADHVLIGRLGEHHSQVESMVLVQKQQKAQAITYELRGTPCENVIEQGICIHECGVQSKFPDDLWLQEHEIQAYAGVPLRGDDGKVFGILAALSEQRIADDRVSRTLLQVFSIRVTNELRRLHDDVLAHRSRFAMDHAGDAIFVIDEQARFVDVNETAARRLGYSRDQLLQMGVGDIDAQFPMERWPQHWQELRDRGSFQIESVHRRSDGTTFPVEIVAALMKYRGVEHNCALARDVTYRQRAIAERAQLETELRHSQKMEAVGTLAGGIAHDFNNLLTAVFGNIDLAMLEIDDRERVGEYLQALRRVAQQGAEMTRSLLMFAHKAPSASRVMDLRKELLDATRMLRRLLPASVELSPPDPRGEAVFVHADPTQMKQVLMNLAVNAQLAMPEGGRLAIDVGVEEDATSATRWAVIRVEDNGCGMDDATMARIFEPFFTTRPREQGTGLGLAIVHGIVRDHDGTVRVTSKPGIGSCFVVRLPLADTPMAEPTVEIPAQPPARCDTTVLLAEDNEMVRTLIANNLRAVGCRVVEATDGAHAVSLFEATPNDIRVALLDLDMPQFGGIGCCERLRQVRADLPVIAMSGNLELLALAGARLDVPTIRKPFDSAQLLETVQQCLASVAQN